MKQKDEVLSYAWTPVFRSTRILKFTGEQGKTVGSFKKDGFVQQADGTSV